jgi:hypothetical protein
MYSTIDLGLRKPTRWASFRAQCSRVWLKLTWPIRYRLDLWLGDEWWDGFKARVERWFIDRGVW